MSATAIATAVNQLGTLVEHQLHDQAPKDRRPLLQQAREQLATLVPDVSAGELDLLDQVATEVATTPPGHPNRSEALEAFRRVLGDLSDRWIAPYLDEPEHRSWRPSPSAGRW